MFITGGPIKKPCACGYGEEEEEEEEEVLLTAYNK